MRLTKPELHLDAPLRFNFEQDLQAHPSVENGLGLESHAFASRTRLQPNAAQSSADAGILQLPTSFGAIYLGEVCRGSHNI